MEASSQTTINAPIEISAKEYQTLKEKGQLDFSNGKTYQVSLTAEELKPIVFPKATSLTPKSQNSNNCLPYSGSCTQPGYTLVPNINIGNDDGSSSLINLPFTFCLYGNQYNACYVNNNGNISFGQPVGAFSSTGFPGPDAMVAPFWADFDTRTAGQAGGGCLVQMQITSGYLRVLYNEIAYYNQQTDKLNSCEVIITDGTDPILPAGTNCAFVYGDMQWTTGSASQGVNGFGGIAATVGANKGDGVNFFQIGRFDQAGTAYDGPFGNNDGVSWLDNKTFVFDVCGTTNSNNLAPVSIANYTNCNTQVICSGDTLYYQYNFVGPEDNQNVTISLDTGLGIPGTEIILLNNGSFGSVEFFVVNSVANGQTYNVNIVATDNGNPPQSTTIPLTIALGNTANVDLNPIQVLGNPIICEPGSSELTITTPSNQYLAIQWNNNTFNDTATVTQGGQYWATVTANSCQTFFSDTLTVSLVNPDIAVTGTQVKCGDSTQLTITSNNSSTFYWITGTQEANETFTTDGDYFAYVESNGCVDSVEVSVKLYPIPPAPTVTGNLHACQGGTTPVSVPSGFSGYSWSNGTANDTANLPEGNYIVTVSQTNPGGIVCTSPPTNVSITGSQFEVAISGADTVCQPNQLLTAITTNDSLNYTYLWSSGNTVPTSTEPGTGSSSQVSVIATDEFGCQDTAYFQFWAFAPPTAYFTAQPPSLSPSSTDIVFSDSSYVNTVGDTIVSWHWNFGNEDDPTLSDDTLSLQNPTYQYADTDTGQTTIQLIITSSIGCTDTFNLPYTIANELLFYNVLAPESSEDRNNRLIIDNLVQMYPENELRVYNRWGIKVFEQKNYRNDWRGDKLVSGTYYYVLSTRDGGFKNYFQLFR